ncbi:MAG TPA: RNA ligase family protein, partial [Polyangia bacterium]
MAATLTRERFSGPEWVFERKLDGIRLLAFKDGPRVRLLSRNRLAQNAAYPSFQRALEELPVRDVILDGEATGWFGRHEEVGYHVFDVLWLDGRDLTSLPLDARRAILESLPLRPPLLTVERLADERPWERAALEGWEGVIAKRRDSLYEHRRSPHWLKMKCESSQEFVVGGFTDPQGARVGLGALLVGHYDGDDFVFAGKVGTGF